jgi:hypothetical protein
VRRAPRRAVRQRQQGDPSRLHRARSRRLSAGPLDPRRGCPRATTSTNAFHIGHVAAPTHRRGGPRLPSCSSRTSR